jgi:hypothetical protein
MPVSISISAVTAATVAYAVAVFPQAGLFQNGPQLVANRYSYLACLPLALLAGGLIAKLAILKPRDSAYPVELQWPRAAVAGTPRRCSSSSSAEPTRGWRPSSIPCSP